MEDRTTPALLAAPNTFPAGINASLLVVADFNKDGTPDAAVTNDDVNTVSVLLGNASGGFQSPITTPVNGDPAGLAVADFNNDTIPDLAVTRGDNTVVTLLGKGNGFFDMGAGGALAGSALTVLTTGDFNKDGNADIAVSRFGATVRIATGDGAGGLTFTGAGLGVTGGITDLAAIDLDQDADLDLVVVTSGGGAADGVYLLEGDGGGGFLPEALPSTVGLDATGIAVGNFDGNTSPDFVVSFSNAAPAIFRNTAGAFTLDTASLGAGAGNLPPARAITTVDLNQDGRSDVAVVDANLAVTNRLAVAVSDGMGGYLPDPDGPFATGNTPSALAAADFNGDGPGDLVVTNRGSSTLSTYLCRFNTTTTITNVAAPATYGAPVVLNAQVLPDLDLAAGMNGGGLLGSVRFFANGVLLGSANVNLLGQASLSVPTITGLALPVGFASITAQFTGNFLFKGSTSAPFGQVVTPGTVTTGVAGGGTSVFGQPVVFVATVTPPLLPPQVVGPTGTVTFLDGTTVLGIAPLVQSSGGAVTYTATFTTSDLAAGAHPTITATYNGDPNWNAAGPSAAISHSVTAAVAAVALAVSPPGPIALGESIVLTAHVTGNAGTPTGTVLFSDGATILGAVILQAGRATLATNSLLSGNYVLSATYLGNGVYSATGSNGIALSVVSPTNVFVARITFTLFRRQRVTVVRLFSANTGQLEAIIRLFGRAARRVRRILSSYSAIPG